MNKRRKNLGVYIHTSVFKEDERGITLVALMITIIVLILLAVITVSSLMKYRFVEIATNGMVNYAKIQAFEQGEMDNVDNRVVNTVDKISDKLVNNGAVGGRRKPRHVNA